MLYFNAVAKEDILNILGETNQQDLQSVSRKLSEQNYDFASIKSFDDGSLEILHGNDYILLGPCGGINAAKGKYAKYDCFDYDMDEFDIVLQSDIKTIVGGSIPVINLG